MTRWRNKSAPVATREGDRLRHAGRERQATPRVRSACATLADRDARARTCDSPPRAAAIPSNPRGDGTLFRWKRQRRGCNFFGPSGTRIASHRDTASSGCIDRSTSLQATHDPTTRAEAKARADRPRPPRILKPTVAPPSLRKARPVVSKLIERRDAPHVRPTNRTTLHVADAAEDPRARPTVHHVPTRDAHLVADSEHAHHALFITLAVHGDGRQIFAVEPRRARRRRRRRGGARGMPHPLAHPTRRERSRAVA